MNNFFQKLEPIANAADLQFTIKAKNGQLTVMVVPKSEVKDTAVGNIVPLLITGTAAELDEAFIDAVSRPLAAAAGVLNNIATFEESTQKANSQSEAVKKQKEQEQKAKEKAKAQAKEAQPSMFEAPGANNDLDPEEDPDDDMDNDEKEGDND